MSYIMKMPYRSAAKLIIKAAEQNTKDLLFKLYNSIYPNMGKKTFVSFDEFYKKAVPKKIELDTRSKDEIMQEIKIIQRRFEQPQ
ncbi:hypothetical protein [Acetobacterium sp.]|uniref:hypothetical protein n=1 Tax=Acetobacterium sp. TaxID=1872094 RepID=UPI002F42C601